jgi:hypothetical protein
VSPLRQPVADVLPTVYCPEDYGLKAWNWNPDAALATLTTRLNSTAGRLNIFRLSLPKPTLITNIHTMITATPTTLTAGQCGVALCAGTWPTPRSPRLPRRRCLTWPGELAPSRSGPV